MFKGVDRSVYGDISRGRQVGPLVLMFIVIFAETKWTKALNC